ncbi:hypothetical protein ACRE_077560 [Hapsidospora chrysogenum ATCC 11550]|uniref:Uncharacterized protein n=1 Tax=Hapsidospora chrysogenum (strain ATCC 11550 / CBS 779.69 / DSM 880 / IAM 14645 / JCM 23072 / IMI 49137) TaxID=857340 RepID=A0A086SWP0_HAPC1|nr:hypothetical protein ACRE_077560 [Hapsidospora chrysogenum ATCC 11550]
MSEFEKDPALCEEYAQFASHMVRWQFKIMYWVMFMTNLFILFLASWTFTKGQEAIERFGDDTKKRAKRLRFFIYMCLMCVVLSAVIVIMEAYALMALQFCDGEHLMSLYWSTWTMIQVGSLIAMVGIILAMMHSLKNSKHPPWALALGTPVLVIAGFLHLIHAYSRKGIRKIKRCDKFSSGDEDKYGPPMSQANTIQVPDDDGTDKTMYGEFIGFTVQGGPIVRFNSSVKNTSLLGDNMELLGYCDGDRPIVAYRNDVIRFISGSDQSLEKAEFPMGRN